MAREVLNAKLESLSRILARIESKSPISREALQEDYDLQDVLVLNLERAVQTCSDIASHLISTLGEPTPPSMAGGFDALASIGVITADTAARMRKAVAFRNVAVHEYTAIDWSIVAAILEHHLGDFRIFAREVASWLDNTPEKA